MIPIRASAHTQLGQLMRIRGQLDDAVEQYLRALEIDPDYTPARRGLAATEEARRRLRGDATDP
jgi:hypothetical protein